MFTFINYIQQLHEGVSVAKASQDLGINIEIAEIWHDRALHLAQLSTQTGQSKLFEQHRYKTNSCPLAPYRPPSSEEQVLLAILFENAIQLHRNNPEALHIFLDIFLDRVIASKSEIRFKLKEKEKLIEFLLVGHQLIKNSNWRVQAPCWENISELKKEIKSLKLNTPVFKTIFKSEELKRNPKLFDRLTSLESRNYNGYCLSIIYPKQLNFKKRIDKNQSFSSSLLKYACHILAIADVSFSLPPALVRISKGMLEREHDNNNAGITL
jgi:hypothetical protein